MADLLAEVRALALEQVDFDDDQLETLVEQQNEAYGEVHRTTLEFKAAAVNEGIDPTPSASALVRLAGQFGTAFPDLNPDQVAALKANVADIYTHGNPAVEQAGEAVFNATVDFILRTKELKAYVASGGEA